MDTPLDDAGSLRSPGAAPEPGTPAAFSWTFLARGRDGSLRGEVVVVQERDAFDIDDFGFGDAGKAAEPMRQVGDALRRLAAAGVDLRGLDLRGATGRTCAAIKRLVPLEEEGGDATPRGYTLAAADLAGLDLSGADLSDADLRGANLSGADLSGADLADADLADADLRGANLSGADLSGADLADADLRGANLSGANLKVARLNGADLAGARLVGADLAHAKLHAVRAPHVDLSGAVLTRANLHAARLRGANLEGASLHGANLHAADLRDARLARARITRADLHATRCNGADLTGATLDDCRIVSPEFRGARLAEVTAQHLRWRGADLRGAVFQPEAPDGWNGSVIERSCDLTPEHDRRAEQRPPASATLERSLSTAPDAVRLRSGLTAVAGVALAVGLTKAAIATGGPLGWLETVAAITALVGTLVPLSRLGGRVGTLGEQAALAVPIALFLWLSPSINQTFGGLAVVTMLMTGSLLGTIPATWTLRRFGALSEPAEDDPDEDDPDAAADDEP